MATITPPEPSAEPQDSAGNLPARGLAVTSLDDMVPDLLATVRSTLGMDVAFVSEFAGGQRVFRHVEPASGTVIHAGGADPLESSWCQRIVQGRLPRFIPDTSVHYQLGDVEPPPFAIGTHLSVPIVLSDGRIFGTLCCFSFERRDSVRESDLTLLHAIAHLLAAAEDRKRLASAAYGEVPTTATGPVTADVAAITTVDAVPQMLEVICRTTGMGFSAIARVTDTQWICCASRDEIGFGLHSGGELPLETTICNEIRQHQQPVVIDDVASSGQYNVHPTPARYGFRSYISFPIVRRDGSFWGTLCAIDPRPASLDKQQVRGMFKLFADLVSFHLEAHERLHASESALLAATETARRREQFVAAVGHDLRTPLQAISGGLAVLERMPDQAPRVLPMMGRSLGRIGELVHDLMDLARGQLGSGMRVMPVWCTDLGERLTHVVEEIRAARPDAAIDFQCSLQGPVWCDPVRIVQVVANLLSNAVTHGRPGTPIAVAAATHRDAFVLTTSNQAPDLAAEDIGRLFQPYFRPVANVGSSGLGLGLYIVSEIAKAHGGRASAAMRGDELLFTVSIPASPAA